ncbi:MAG: hypothetical protein RL486_1436, partial [Actinomycetota bacterium]
DFERPAVFLTANRAESLSLAPHGIGPSLDQSLGFGRKGVGSHIDIPTIAHIPAQKQVADNPTDQIELVSRRGKALSQRARPLKNGKKAFGDHRAEATGAIPCG